MAGCGHHEQDQRRRDAEGLEWKADEFSVVAKCGQFGNEIRQRILRSEPLDHQPCMGKRDQECQHAEVASIVEQRQEPAVQPAERSDRQDNGEHQESAGPSRPYLDVDRIGQSFSAVQTP